MINHVFYLKQTSLCTIHPFNNVRYVTYVILRIVNLQHFCIVYASAKHCTQTRKHLVPVDSASRHKRGLDFTVVAWLFPKTHFYNVKARTICLKQTACIQLYHIAVPLILLFRCVIICVCPFPSKYYIYLYF